MRQISKPEADIEQFNKWAKLNKLHLWQEFSSPHSKLYPQYKQIREHIAIDEQNSLSAYTEKPLGSEYHIDHFRKRSIFPNLTFDYSNFLVDDRNDNYGACFKDDHANVTKDTFDGVDRIYCPVTENMSDFISFTFDGTMVPRKGLGESEIIRVKETIRVFNLNHKSLKTKRSDIIKIITDYKSAGLSDSDIRDGMKKVGFPTLVNWILINV